MKQTSRNSDNVNAIQKMNKIPQYSKYCAIWDDGTNIRKTFLGQSILKTSTYSLIYDKLNPNKD